MTQRTLFSCWHPPEIIVPDFVWRCVPSVEAVYFGLYHYVADFPFALAGLMWWFDTDGHCDDWRLIE